MRSRVWYKASRLLRAVSPIQLMIGWTYEHYDWHEDKPSSWRFHVAAWVIWKWHVLCAIARCLFARGDDDLLAQAWWARPLYRAKAIICLLLGWHSNWYEHDREPKCIDCLTVVWWNGGMSGYYEPEWEQDDVGVPYGWRNWFVDLNVSEFER